MEIKGWRNAAYGTLLHAAILFPLEIHPARTITVPLRSQQTVQNILISSLHTHAPVQQHTLTAHRQRRPLQPHAADLSAFFRRVGTIPMQIAHSPSFHRTRDYWEKRKQCVELIMNAVTDNGHTQQVTRL